jgi:hypothetical protein
MPIEESFQRADVGLLVGQRDVAVGPHQVERVAQQARAVLAQTAG